MSLTLLGFFILEIIAIPLALVIAWIDPKHRRDAIVIALVATALLAAQATFVAPVT